ncbi:MAG TPA: iron ABC transporter permease [Candidatus Limnocylindria bacterium]|nr:iron ABC transporter permease [Candidatus Limnocylindria bacterium]
MSQIAQPLPPIAARGVAESAWKRRLPSLLVLALVIVIGFLVLYPLVMLVLGSFAPPRGVTDVTFSLDGYRTALSDADAQKAIVTTLWLSLVRAVLGVALALLLAWAISRTNVPARRLFHGVMLISFFLPLLPQLVAWSLLLSPRTGTLNVWIRALVGSDALSGPFNIYSYEGIIFLGVLGWSGFLYLFIQPAFDAIDSSLEEAARMSGATSLRTIIRVSAPLLMPAVLGAFGLAFIRMFESFETELFLGAPAHIYVFTTQIYAYIAQELTPRYPPAIALSTVFVLLTFGLILIQRRILGNRSFVTIGGKGYKREPADLGLWRWLVFALLVFYSVVHLVLPLGMLLLGSLQRTTVQFSMDAFTLDHWKVLFSADVWNAVKNTLIVGVASSTIAILLMSVISYVIVRTQFRLRGALDVLTWVPYMVPSFVLGVGFLWAALKGIQFPFVLYGSIALLIIAFVVRVLPLGTRLMNGTMVQLSTELEEAARISGAGWTSTFRKIVLPILSPALGIGWLMFMVTVIRDLSTVILIYGPASAMLSVVFYAHWKSGTAEDAAVIGLLMTIIGMAMAAGIFALQHFGGRRARGLVEGTPRIV